MVKILFKKNISFILVFLLIFTKCFRIPEENLRLAEYESRKQIDFPTLIIFKYTINGTQNYLDSITEHDLKNIKLSIQNAFNKKYNFTNLKVLPENENLDYFKKYLTRDLNIIYIHIDEKYLYKTLGYYNNPPPITFLSLGLIPSFENYDFSIKYTGNNLKNNAELQYVYRFQFYSGWFLIPYSYFWNRYKAILQSSENKERYDLEFIISKSLENISIEN
jgi:hypothetical protein